MQSTFSSKANPQQLQAIQATEGALLIIAGPGSGKTFTLVERIVYLITQKQIAPENLLVVTFTDKASQELTTRISNRLLELGIRFNLNEMYLGTFHSICLRWLEEHRDFTRLKRNFMMMDQFDQQYFIYYRLSKFLNIPNIELVIGGHKQSTWDKSEKLMKWINRVSEEALNPKTLINASETEVAVLGHCYALYQKYLEEENAIDFSTIQSEALKLLQKNPKILAELQAKIKYLMVDEYQDTNTIQELLLNCLAGDRPNLCVVGDDDQGLYRFRGASIRNILQFKNQFPNRDCEQIYLTTNYRSHPDIIDFYNRWMKEQEWEDNGKEFRFQKVIKAREDKLFPEVPCVVKVSGKTQQAWHQEVLAFLHTLKDKGHLTDWNQVAFLFRSVKSDKAVALSQFLEKNGINVYSPRSNQFFEREEIRLMIGALIFLFPQYPNIRKWNDDAHLEIWDYYDNQCFQSFAYEIRQPENADLWKWARAIAKTHLNLSHNTDYAFSGLFYRLLQFPLFSCYLDESLLQQKGIQNSRSMRNLAIFSQLLDKFEYLYNIDVLTTAHLEKNLKDLFNQFFKFLEDGGIDEYEDKSEYAPSGCVSFLTIHQSKGLEFPVVITGSLEAVPRKQYTQLDELLENNYLLRQPFEPLELIKFFDFRRLFYTAFSRAQNILVLSCLEKDGKGQTPSKYFTDFYNSLPSWRNPNFQPEALLLEKVKDVNLKREYSFTSHLTLYENCAEQYRFFKELEFAPSETNSILFGTVVHQTIEDIHKTVLRGEEYKLSEEQVIRWFDTNYAYLTKRERAYLAPNVKRAALEQVVRYYQKNHGNWERVKEAEVDVSLVKDDYILKGSIDLIQGENDTVEIVDFKSEKKLDVNNPKDREKLDRYRRQLEVYAHIVENRTGLTVSKTHLYYTSEESGNPYITFSKNSRSIDKTIATFDEVVKRIEVKDFRIAERPNKLCKGCDMRFYCDTKNWIFRK
ncbi:ATP-dependent helicase [Nostoc spongiaeforme FACHB-130]|uniref:DNA 3'-5' helicase n=1 Tax=Nostoc spongiaeforme FACHB-130 TaxID=1357510 RepID=A0ABR8FX69_9NOSO|nr:ATP-dependent DNA helicase [Nostoc spongiaeforme]MBD2596032.1 ATP-dependent helicase [Nostoc spongiaeforme FACHB-130]